MATSLPTTVLLVEDDPLARHAYRSLLESLAPSIRLVGEAASPEAALEHAFALQPRVVLVDLQLGTADGLDLTRGLIHRGFTGGVLVVSVLPDEPYALRALEAGARGYLRKDHVAHELERAIRAVGRGRPTSTPPPPPTWSPPSSRRWVPRPTGPRDGPDPQGAGNPGPSHPGTEQQGDRRRPPLFHPHRQSPRLPDPPEAGRGGPDPSRPPGGPLRARQAPALLDPLDRLPIERQFVVLAAKGPGTRGVLPWPIVASGALSLYLPTAGSTGRG